MNTYSEIITDLESRGVMPDIEPKLERIQTAVRRVCPEIDGRRVILVGGTNGKGSVAITLATLLRSAGESVGLYTSPHLVDTTERIQINLNPISKDKFVEVFQGLDPLVKDLNLTHFEMLTLMAAWFFDEKNLDRMIFEVGLGGSFDATNTIPHTTSIVTSVDFDHQHLLGETLESILENKFGILPPKSPSAQNPHVVITGKLPEPVWEKVDTYRSAQHPQTEWHESESFEYFVERSESGPEFFINTKWGRQKIELAGMRGAQNSTIALSAFEALGFDPSKHLQALSRVRWPGRMQRLSLSRCPLYVSGDHNPAGIQSLVEFLPYYPRKHLHLVVGVGKNKDISGILGPLFELKDTSVYLTETPFQGRGIQEYGHYMELARSSHTNPDRAMDEAIRNSREGDLILVTGSLYLVGHVMERFL